VSWFRLDDNVTFHRKTLAAGNEAFGAWCRMGAHASLQLTDGFIDEAAASLIAGRKAVVDRLVTVGFLVRVEGGYRIHDFHDYNPTADEVRSNRERLHKVRSEAGKLGGKRSGEARRSKPAATDGSTDEAEAKQPAKQVASGVPKQNEAPSRPLPSPKMLPSEAVAPAEAEAPPARKSPRVAAPIRAALDALHRLAPRRFPAIEDRDLTGEHRARLATVCKNYGPADWQALGEAAAAGAAAKWPDEPVTPGRLASNWLSDEMVKARAWAAERRADVAEQRDAEPEGEIVDPKDLAAAMAEAAAEGVRKRREREALERKQRTLPMAAGGES
jgi:hypothetical protein